MGGGDGFAAVEVGDGARHLEDAVVGAGAEAEAVHGLLQDELPRFVNATIFTHHPAAHLRVGEQLAHDDIIRQMVGADVARCRQNADGDAQVVGRALLFDVGRERYFDSTIFLPKTSV